MADVHTPQQRSFNMSRIRSKNTTPELALRRMVHALGFRYRLHAGKLPGRPDMVFASRHKVIFVHGCYWHMHTCRWGCVTPKTNAGFWRKKRAANAEQDRRNLRKLKKIGWKVLTLWECQTKDENRIEAKIARFLAQSSR